MTLGWQEKPFESCLDRFKVTAKIPKKQFADAGQFPIVSQEADFINGYWDDAADVCNLETPVVIYGDHTQVVKYVDFDFVVGADGVKVLKPKDFIAPRFLYYFVMAHRVPSLGYARHYRHLKDQEIKYPPLEEQQKIIAVLDDAFEGLARARAHAEANLQNARELFDNFTTGVFSQIIEEHGQTTLEDICEFIKDGTHQTPKYFDSGFLFLSAKNIKGGRLDWEDVKYIDEAQHIAMQKRLSPRVGDLLIRKNGAGYGAAALVDRDVIFDVYVSLAVLRPKEGILPEYLLQFANSSFAQTQFKDRIKGQGVPNLHLQEIKQVKLPVPKDVAVQNDIAERIQSALEAVRVVESNYQKKLQDVGDLRQSLLQKAFAGELT